MAAHARKPEFPVSTMLPGKTKTTKATNPRLNTLVYITLIRLGRHKTPPISKLKRPIEYAYRRARLTR